MNSYSLPGYMPVAAVPINLRQSWTMFPTRHSFRFRWHSFRSGGLRENIYKKAIFVFYSLLKERGQYDTLGKRCKLSVL